MPTTTLFDDLKKSLQDLKDFLAANKAAIQTAVSGLKTLGLPIGDLIDRLAGVLGKLKTEIANLDLSQITGLAEMSTFTGNVRTMLEAAKKLLPDESADIDQVLGISDVVSGLPSLDQVKQQITDLITAIEADLDSLQ